MDYIDDSNFLSFRAECDDLSKTANRLLVDSRPVLIFGAGQFGKDVCRALLNKGFEVIGFIETAPQQELIFDLPVFTWGELSLQGAKSQLVIGIYNRATPLDQLEQISRTAGFQDIFMPWEIFTQFENSLGWRYWLSPSSFITSNVDSLEHAYNSLSDSVSRECLLNICRFRLGVNTPYGSFQHADNQYFNALTMGNRGTEPVRYVDGGAYNGDTFIELAGVCNLTAAHLFEPDPDNFQHLCNAVATKQTAAVCLPLALSSAYKMLSFNGGNGEAGAVSNYGNTHIAAVALDEVLHDHPVDFIKLDVEGSELQALMGSANIITRYRPTLAISLYHKAEDLWEIPNYLKALCPDYKIYLRQHWFNSFDSVLYAIPNSADT